MIHCSSTDQTWGQMYYLTLLNIEPTNGITSFPILACPKWDLLFPVVGNKKVTPPTMRTTDVRWKTWRIPKWLAASGFDHRQAIHLLQHCSSMSHKDSSRLQRQNKKKVEPSDQSPSSRLPTWQDSSTRSETTQSSIKEAYWRGEQTRSAQSPFSTSDTKQTHPLFFQSERGTMSPWVKPISSQMQTSKRHWFLKPVQVHSDVAREITTKLHREKDLLK